jgi:signal transduction histidine kinase
VGKTRECARRASALRGKPEATILPGVNDTLRLIARRPLTGECWRDTGYLLGGLVLGILGFTFIVSAIPTAASLSIVVVGVPIAVLVAHVDRWWCGIERSRAAKVLSRPVAARYGAVSGESWFTRQLSVLTDRQTWFDALWMLAGLPLGIVGFVVAATVWTVVLALFTAPIYLWSIPGWLHAHVIAASIVFPFLGPPAAVAAAWIVRGCALLQAGLAARALGLSRSEELEERVQTLSETRAGAVDAAVSELQRVERDLHDGAQARLVALTMDLGLAEQRLANADPETALEHVAAARGQARAAMAELRDLVRGIGPSILTDRGLDAALTALVSGRVPPVSLTVDLPDAAVTARETAAYFVVAEALANARKHAHASQISVRVYTDAERALIAEVTDDGLGGADPSAGSGLAGLRKRVAALDGVLTVTSPAGGPTTVRAELPCAS